MPSKVKYECALCVNDDGINHVSSQKSHHDTHLKSVAHKRNYRIKELEVSQLPVDERIKIYGMAHASDIVLSLSHIEYNKDGVKVQFMRPIAKPDTIELESLDNSVCWTDVDVIDDNPNYNQIRANLTNIIKRCHDILYGSISATVGEKARDDIVRILTLKLLTSEFAKDESEIYQKCQVVKEEINDADYDKFIRYCGNIELIANTDIFDEWGNLVSDFLSKLLPGVYTESDEHFNCEDELTIGNIIREINKITIDDDFMNAVASNCGDIHEYFRAYEGKRAAKVLGQYFTPRNMINLLFHQDITNTIITRYKDPSIYDPCMGTAGFLARMYKLCNGSAVNIYGCELNNEAIKFGEAGLLLTTGSLVSNIKKCNSLCENPFIAEGKKFDIIATNPPFATKNNYIDIKAKFNALIPPEDGAVKFEDVYSVKTNDGTQLFIQHCVYMLKNGGMCIIILPDGKLFEGKTSDKFRSWLLNTVNIREMIKFPKNVFEHTSIETCALVFTKDGPTNTIDFKIANQECTEVRKLCSAKYVDLLFNNFSMGYRDYVKKEKANHKYNKITLGEVCEIKTGEYMAKGTSKVGQYPVYGGGDTSFKTDTFNRDGGTIVISRAGISENCVRVIVGQFYLNDNGFSIKSNDYNKLSNDYLRYVLLSMQSEIYQCARGTAQKNISMDKFKKLEIPLPPLNIQQQLAKELHTLDKSKQTIIQRIEQYKYELQLFMKYRWNKQIHQLEVDCNSVKLEDICTFLSKSKRKASEGKDNGEYPFYTSSSKLTKYCDTADYNELSIIIGTGGCANIKISKNFSCSADNIVLKHNDETTTKYIYHYFGSNLHMLEEKFKGIGIKHISVQDIKNLEIPLPSLEVQCELIKVYENKIKFAKDIMQKIKMERDHIDKINELSRIIITGA